MSTSRIEVAICDRLIEAREDGFAVEFVEKRTSKLMWLIYFVGFMFIWQREFMDRYVTTVGSTIYFPAGKLRRLDGHLSLRPTLDNLATLRHELQHIRDSRRFGPLWGLLYIFPQCLVLFAFSAFFTPYGWLFLVFLLPLPAPFRVWAEIRGYEETWRTYVDNGAELDTEFVLANMKRIFTGRGYYRMAWRWEPIRRRFAELLGVE